jgi:hypothetical protein
MAQQQGSRIIFYEPPVVAETRTPKQLFEAYEHGVLLRAELFAKLMEVMTAANADEIRHDLGRMAIAFESWIDLFEHGADVVLADRVVPGYVMKRVVVLWRALPPH